MRLVKGKDQNRKRDRRGGREEVRQKNNRRRWQEGGEREEERKGRMGVMKEIEGKKGNGNVCSKGKIYGR